MDTRIYVFMLVDECGDERRAHGSEFLEAEYSFPDFSDDDAMFAAFIAWQSTLEAQGQQEWEEHYGPECKIFLEEKHDSLFKRTYHFYGL